MLVRKTLAGVDRWVKQKQDSVVMLSVYIPVCAEKDLSILTLQLLTSMCALRCPTAS